MRDSVDEGQPRVFLCFAASDHAKAVRLSGELGARGVATVDHEYQIGPGENIVLAAERALSESDYFVLLWSRAATGLSWTGEQWSAALVRGMREGRRFLFVVRLDATPLPHLLASRPQLDASGGWDGVVRELTATWSRERAFEFPVLPAPCPTPPPTGAGRDAGTGTDVGTGTDAGIALYVRNRDLSVYHKLEGVPRCTTGLELEDRIRAELELPREVSKFEGSVGMRFSYRFLNGDETLADKPLPALGLEHGGRVDLEVEVEPFGPGDSATWVFLRDEPDPELPPALVRSLVESAFGHLRPGERER